MSPTCKVDSTSSQLTESDLDVTSPRKITKINKHRQQKFRDAWLKNEDYKQWLSKVPDDQYKAKCRTCNSSSVVVTSLHDKMCKSYQELFETYMSRDYIYRTNLIELDPCNESHRLRSENMYFGIEVRKMLDQVEIRNNEKLKSDFATTCTDFLIEESTAKTVQDLYSDADVEEFNNILMPNDF
ncbi:hypothetical protein KQX54_013844 [Cotesia glomerata]|uniref:Uncharacterized protein n=1 Tax=Cotesia glomerata TaxID=32391 RepID=A0AAV7IF70_COTGL|nr:hypothetical protein KQX54_013844 [Cotesia glomerata]